MRDILFRNSRRLEFPEKVEKLWNSAGVRATKYNHSFPMLTLFFLLQFLFKLLGGKMSRLSTT